MTSRRGKILTVAILAAITLASFAIWLLPSDRPNVFVTTDYAGMLDSTAAISNTLQQSLDEQYGMLLEGRQQPAEYVTAADALSDQISGQILALITSDPPSEWSVSYGHSVESLRALNSAVRETVVMADAMSGGRDTDDIESRIAELRELSAEHARMSLDARP